jgi:hypothetical protein
MHPLAIHLIASDIALFEVRASTDLNKRGRVVVLFGIDDSFVLPSSTQQPVGTYCNKRLETCSSI